MVDISTLQRLVAANLNELEQVRLQQQEQFIALRRRYFRRVGVVFLLLLLGTGLMMNQGDVWIPLMALTIIVTVVLSIVSIVMYFKKIATPKQLLKDRVKEEVYQKVITHLYPNMSYQPKQHIQEAIYKDAGLSGEYDIYKGDDYFEGTLSNGQPLSFSELEVQTKEKDGDNNYNVSTVFKGLFFKVSLPENFAATVKILPDVAERGMGTIGVFLQKKLGKLSQGKSDLVYFEEYPVFEKQFVVYADNEEFARQLITPSLVQVILQLKAITEDIALNFSDDYLYLAVSAKDNFLEVDITKKLTNPSLLDHLVEDLHYSLQLMDYLTQLSSNKIEKTSGQQIIPPTTQKTPSKKSVLSFKKSKSKDNPFLL